MLFLVPFFAFKRLSALEDRSIFTHKVRGLKSVLVSKYRLKDLMKQNKNRIFVTEIIGYGKA